ncbi:MAG: hypothetical protein RLZZ383_177 [Pseudomonadota bacterium]
MSREVVIALAGASAIASAALLLSARPSEPPPSALTVCAHDAVRTVPGGAACVVACAASEGCLHPTGDPAEGHGARAVWRGRAVWLRIDGDLSAQTWHHVIGEAPPADVLTATAARSEAFLTVVGAPDASSTLAVATAWFDRLGVPSWETVVAGRRAADAVEAALAHPTRLSTLGTGPKPDDGSRCAALTGATTAGVCAAEPRRDCGADDACPTGPCVAAALPERAAQGAACPPAAPAAPIPVVARWDVWLAAPDAATPTARDTADGVAWGAAQAWRRVDPEARGTWVVVHDASLAGLWRAWAEVRVNQPR